MASRMKLFFDGGNRPEGMETAVVVRGQAYLQRDLGAGTTLDAEWLALLHALRIARELGLGDVVIVGDSVTVIDQANGTGKCRGDCLRHLEAFHELASADPPRVRYVKRTQNLAGIALARLHDR
jgi:ribonuclease HI